MKNKIIFQLLILLLIHLIGYEGIHVICESNGTKNCTMTMTKDETSLSSDFYNLIPAYRRRDIESILNDTRLSWDDRRDRVNNYFKTYIPYDTMKTYSKLLSDKIERDMEEKFEKTRLSFDKLFREKFNFIKFNHSLFPPVKFDFSEKDFEKLPGNKYMRNEVYTGPYDKSFTQRINTNLPNESGKFFFDRRINRLPIDKFNGIIRPYRYCIPIC
ncbi:Hypothetical protein SRAE_2000297700 [Strongyloides ratti]|uniref:Uncharacterized protein n=1 Tax=Strongyloides ratti TaxID=34506 RepID=A0A090MZ50_STRRB|nr:Hypothetical protein SRAE_2000297700 [Strongyloides ratti]CEF68319.1 Hypothetical protein SRAE_2000297700 [Strongyloides ratti]